MNSKLLIKVFCFVRTEKIYSVLFAIYMLFFAMQASAQQSVVLPSNGSYSQKSGPQGALRAQRGFYLITAKEMQASGLTSGASINSIGFTIGAAQDSTTRGSFKVFLQNTTDAISRLDTNWTETTVTTNSYSATGLVPGTYEWEVSANCTPSTFSPVVSFANDNLSSCSPPTSLTVTNITTSSATLNWVAPASLSVSQYNVEYKNQDDINWTTATSNNLSYDITGLISNKLYQWRVKTACSGDNSAYSGGTFLTNSLDVCNEPTSLTNGTVTNNSAAVSWTGATGAVYYGVQYRRKGTTVWIGGSAFSTSFTFTQLAAGTRYEWQVRTVCSGGTGAFVLGSDFTTTGTTACYAPLNLSTNSITDSSAVLSWDASAGATSYKIRYRLKDAISWTNATTPMTTVHDDSLTIPDTTGPYTIAFTGGSSFTYSGDGVYVAWEYSNSTGRLSSPNTTVGTLGYTIVKGSSGQDSLKNVLSLTANSKNNTSVSPSILTSNSQRPETTLGSSFLKDSVEVAAVYALGSVAPSFASSGILALIKNHSGSTHNYPVTLTVKDQKTNTIRYSNTQNIAVNSNSSQTANFTGWSPSIIETDSLIISIPAQPNENVINNNSNYYIQKVTTSILSYDDGSNAITEAGNDTNATLLLTKYKITNCGKINGVKVYLSSSAKGHSVYAVALNAANNIIAQSSAFTPDSTEVNNYHTFYFPTQVLLKNEEFYVGLAQPASNEGYNPVGVQWEGATPRDNAYFRAELTGDNMINQPQPGRLMIDAELVAGIPTPEITGNLTLCSSTSQTLTAASANVRFADQTINFSSQNTNVQYSADQALGTTDVYPDYATNPNAWVSASADGSREYITFHFSNPAKANFIDIYETLNPGAVDTVYVKNPTTSAYDMVYSGTATAAPKTARRNRITFPLTAYNVSEVRIALNSPAVPGFNAIDAVGIGELQNPATFSTYLWTPGGETTQTKSVSSPGTYKLTVTDGNGCQASNSVDVVSPAQVVPTVTATRPLTFCQGDSTILKSSQKGGNTWSTGATTDSIIVKTAGSYTVTYNDGCSNNTSSATAVAVNTLPSVSITPHTASICAGGSATLDAGSGFNGYLWSNGATTQTATFTNTGTYNVKVTGANGCKASDAVTITAAAALSPSISGNLSFCPGSNTQLDAGSGYNNYLWSTGETSHNITASTAGTYTVTVSNSNGCRGSVSVNTSMFPTPAPVISGNRTFCPGGSTILSGNNGFNSYSWSDGANSSNGQSLTVSSANTYTLTVTDAHSCSGSQSVVARQSTPPSPIISGSLSFCGGNSTTLDAGTGYSAYSWSTGATTQTIAATTVNTFTVTVTDSRGCTGSASVTTTSQSSIPQTPGPISGTTTGLCNTTGNVYSISPVTNATQYVWTVPTGATITSGQGTTSITVNYGSSFTTGNIVVAASNACGQSGSVSPRTLAVQSTLATPTTINGQLTGLCGKTSQVYSIDPIPNATSYTWTVPNGAAILGSPNGTSVNVSFVSSFASGSLCVNATNACGSGATKCATLSRVSSITTAIAGPVNVCSKQKGVVYSIPAVTGATSYTWTVPSQATITAQVNNSTTSSITVTFGTKGGNVTVKANNSCGSSNIQTLAVIIKCTTITKNIMSKPLNEDVSVQKSMKVYPNPSTGIVNLKFENCNAGAYKVNVFDVTGKMVYSKGLTVSGNSIVLDLRHLSKGTYLLNLIGSNTNDVVKVVVN